MPPLNDDILAVLGTDFGDNSVYPSPGLLNALIPVLEVEAYRRRLVQITEFVVANGTTNTTVTMRMRPGPDTAWLVVGAAWQNQQPGSEAALEMLLERTDPAVPDFFRIVGNAVIMRASTEVVVGPMALQTTAVPVTSEQRPAEIFVPADAELRFNLTKSGGGVLEGGAQRLELSLLEVPRQKTWVRFRAQTVLVTP